MANLEEVFLGEDRPNSSNLVDSKEDIDTKSKDILIRIPNSDRVISCMEHGVLHDYSYTIFFIPGAGFGRVNNPDYNNILSQLNARLIIIDRPGYGLSTYHKNRTYQTFADDLLQVLSHFRLDKEKSYFIAHSAGCPHLLSFCHKYPDRVADAAIVCPPNPLRGKAPHDRPNEPTCARSCQRCCAVHLLCCLSCCVNPLLESWEKDPKQFEKFTISQLKTQDDKEWFLKKYPERISLYTEHFSNAVHAPNGKRVLFQDMFELSTKDWGFAISNISCPIQVWYGTDDDITPNGKWYVQTLQNAKGFEENGHGHSLIYVKFDKIVQALVKP